MGIKQANKFFRGLSIVFMFKSRNRRMEPVQAKRPNIHLQTVPMAAMLPVFVATSQANVTDAEFTTIDSLPLPLNEEKH